MRQYLDLLKEIKQKGTKKPPAREGMPGSLSLFGYQYRHTLNEGFPLITTKKMFWKGVVTELLWFLRGDTNIKYLVDNGVHIWDEDAYNYYKKVMPAPHYEFEEFVTVMKSNDRKFITPHSSGYRLGDCGFQYGKLWRGWEAGTSDGWGNYYPLGENNCGGIDQIKNVIQSLKSNPLGRRHIVTAWDPAHLDDMALNACHVLFQFNCRPLDNWEQLQWLEMNGGIRNKSTEHQSDTPFESEWSKTTYMVDKQSFERMPKYYLDCHLYQRSADVFLG